jgi:hypothetical protein
LRNLIQNELHKYIQNRQTGGSLRISVSLKEALYQFIPADSKMSCHISQNTGKGSHLEGIMIGNCHVMLSTFEGGQPEMAPALAGGLISKPSEQPGLL